MTIELTEAQVRSNKALFDWCLSKGRRAIARRHYIQATRWCQLAAETAGFGCGLLASQELEFLLLDIAKQIPSPPTAPRREAQKHWLHVMTRTDSVGGHNALIKRWIELNPKNERHSVVVLDYQDPDENDLQRATDATGGQFHYLGNLLSRPIDCAWKLRELAWTNADYVVLHHHMWDVIPTLAFGIPGGPPVLLMNMADHLFWVGASIADLILQLRPESTVLSKRYRGTDRSYLLNIPLPEMNLTQDTDSCVNLRENLGIPPDALVFLTIGRATKYEPREGIDFISCAKDLLERLPSSYLIAVGPTIEHPAWRSAHEATRGRLIPVGSQRNLKPYYKTSDIYLEGFPFGSLTALLEAGLTGLPCVRAPAVVPPIFRSTGPSIEDLPVPADPASYVKLAVGLATLPRTQLKQMGEQLSEKVEQFHRSGWVKQLANIPIPDQHRNYSLGSKVATLTLADAKILRWLDGDALQAIRWKAGGLGVDASIDLELIIKALRQLPDVTFIQNLFRVFLENPVRQPQVKSIS